MSLSWLKTSSPVLAVALFLLATFPPIVRMNRLSPFSSVDTGAKPALAGEGAEEAITKCGSLKKSGATYVLKNDVSSSGSCFSVEADRITLKLNGHTIQYATEPQKRARFGISGIACWDPTLKNGNADGAPCGMKFDNFTLVGPGSIIQGSGATAYSHPIRFGQGLWNGPVIHDVNFEWSAPSSVAIEINYAGGSVPGGAKVFNCAFHNNVTAVVNRHAEEGQSVKIEQSKEVAHPTLIYGNTVIGGAQGGLYTEAPGSQIYGNNVSQAGTYTNDFGIYAWGKNLQVHNNVVRPTEGRGILISGVVSSTAGANVYANTIEVIEKPNNAEYGGCQMGGTYGIQFDDNPNGATAYQNDVTAVADQCDGTGLRVTDSRVNSKNQSHDNQYVAKKTGSGSGRAFGLGLSGPSGFTMQRDTFVADTANLFVDWDGAKNITCSACTLRKGSNASPKYVTFSFGNGKAEATNLHFLDTKFENGARKDSTDMRPIGSSQDWPAYDEYFIDWTLTLTVEDQSGASVAGAAVEMTDALHNVAYRGNTDKTGKISTPLTEFRMYNTPSAVKIEEHTPYALSVQKPGCQAISGGISIALTATTERKLQLACSSK